MESKPCQTVYVRGFPEDSTVDSLKDIFAEFGSIVKCFIHKTGTYGMVEFENVSSCTKAIHSLHNQPPLKLYVGMAKTQAVDKNAQKNKYTSERVPEFDVMYEEEEFYVDENNSVVNILKDPFTNEIYVPIRFATNIRRIVKKVPVPVNQLLNNTHEINANFSDDDEARSEFSNSSRKVNFKPKANDLNITVELETDSPKGKNHFQNGEQNRRNFNRSAGGSHSSNSEDENRRGKFQRGPFKNDFSNKFPISEKGEGNRNDTFNNKFKPKPVEQGNWEQSKPQHNSKPFQNKFPKNEEWNESEQRPQSSVSNESFTKKFPSKQEREPVEQKHHNSISNESLTKKFPSNQEKEQPIEQKHHSSISNESFTKKFPSKQEPEQPEEQNPHLSSSQGAVAKMFNKKPTCKYVELPLNKFTEVKVEHAESESKGWVQICSMFEEFTSFMEKVLIYAYTDSKPIKPEVGLICLANFDDTWFRAIILKSYPKVYVRFIDYGNECEVDGDILECPTDLQSVPAFAVCICLNNGAFKLKTELTLKVKPVNLENDVYEVQLENEISSEEEVVNPLSSCQESMMAKLKPSMDGLFQYTSKLSDTEGIAFFLPNSFDQEIIALEKISKAVESLSPIKAKVGELIAAVYEDWNRAVVLETTNGFKVGFIDFGIIKTVTEVKPLPKEFHSIPQFTCQFTTKNLSNLTIQTEAVFEITKVEKEKVHCNLSCEDDIIPVSFSIWNPVQGIVKSGSTSVKSDIKRIPKLKLKSGDECKIVHSNPEYIFVRTKEAVEMVKKIDISEYAAHAPKLTEAPTVGQYVAAEFNGSWFRAIVTNVTSNAANVLFVDYGNEEVKTFFSLKQLNDHCADIPYTIIRIKLRGFTDKQLSPKCLAFLENTKQILIATFDSIPENGVDLTTKDGKNITDELLKLESQGPNQLRKEPYMNVRVPGNEDKRITTFDIECIPVGETEVKFLGVIDIKKYVIAVCPCNAETLHRIHVELLNQITKYANLVAPRLPYLAELNEIVLVAHAGKWYRGLTIGSKDRDRYEIYLLDYGFDIEVTADDLRKMPTEFIDKYKTLASFAVIKGLPPRPSKKLTDRIVDYFIKNEVYKVDVIGVQDYESQTYEILFPGLLRLLRAENFI